MNNFECEWGFFGLPTWRPQLQGLMEGPVPSAQATSELP